MLDDITKTIAIELQIKVAHKIAVLTHRTNNFDAWKYVTQAYFLVTNLGKENLFSYNFV